MDTTRQGRLVAEIRVKMLGKTDAEQIDLMLDLYQAGYRDGETDGITLGSRAQARTMDFALDAILGGRREPTPHGT